MWDSEGERRVWRPFPFSLPRESFGVEFEKSPNDFDVTQAPVRDASEQKTYVALSGFWPWVPWKSTWKNTWGPRRVS
eukprot:6838688-Pyramimonas_sp.AAC.1